MKTESIFRDAALAARMRPKELDDPLWADAPHERLCRLLLAAVLVVAVAWGALWPVERTVVREGVLVLAGDGGEAHVVLFVDRDLAATVEPGARVRVRSEGVGWAGARSARVVDAARPATEVRRWLPRRADASAPPGATHRLRVALDEPWSGARDGMRVEGAVAVSARRPLLRLPARGAGPASAVPRHPVPAAAARRVRDR